MKSLNLLLASKIAFYLAIFIYPISYVQNQETNTSKDLADSIAQFTAKLYSKSKNQTANYFISPYSIWMALSMCYAGAKGNTSSEMKNLLSYGKKSDLEIYQQIENYLRTVINATNVKYTLNLANRLYTNGSIKFNDQYINVLGKYFKADIEKLNFSNSVAAAETVNKFVSNKTNNLIKDIVEPNTIDKADLLVINTLYFKSYWQFRFKSTYTQKENFTSLNGKSISVDMMSLGSKNFNCWVEMKDYDLATACEIPYEDRKIAMTIILPNRNSSLRNLEKKLDLNSFKNIINSNKNLTKANFNLPRFTIKYKQEMSNDLKSLGATTPFSEAADFTGISSSKKFKISQVIHQTYVNVNEDGTEAAAATLIEMLGSTPTRPIEFKCDRPFIFIIHDLTSKAILYIGKLTNP